MRHYTLENLKIVYRGAQKGIAFEALVAVLDLGTEDLLSPPNPFRSGPSNSPVNLWLPPQNKLVPKLSKRKAPAGELTESIVAFLREAGPKGATFSKIGKSIGRKRSHVSSWYYGYGRRNDVAVLIGTAHITLKLFVEPQESKSENKEAIQKSQSIVKSQEKPKYEKTLTERIVDYLEGYQGVELHYQQIAPAIGTGIQNLHSWWFAHGRRCPNVRKPKPSTLTYVKTTHSRTKTSAAPEEIGDKAAAFLKVFGTEGANKSEIGKALGMKGKAFVKWFYSPAGRNQQTVIKIGPSMFAYKAPKEAD